MKTPSTKGVCTELAGTIENPFFDQKYNRHAHLYSYSNEQLPLIVRTTNSFVLPKEPVTVKANSKLDIKTGIALIRKPPGCRITISFNILPVGAHNWDLCSTKRIQYDDCDLNSILCVSFDNSWNQEDVQVGYMYLTLFNCAGAVFGVREEGGTEWIRVNTYDECGVDCGDLSMFHPCYSQTGGIAPVN